MNDPVPVPDLADLDRPADAVHVAEVIAPSAHPEEEFHAPHAERVHLAVHIGITLHGFFEITICTLAGQFTLLSQKDKSRGVVTRRRTHTDG